MLNLAESSSVLRELSLHPVHLTENTNGELPPSALVPFCTYQMDHNMLGQVRPELNVTVCDKFKPLIMDGQLCYALDVARWTEKSTAAGRANGLFLLLDPNPYGLNMINGKKIEDQPNEEKSQAKIYVHLLAQYTAIGPGSYAMSSLKRMTGTRSFEQLPNNQKKCLVHNREECQAKKFLDQVKSKCYCVPWALASESDKVYFTFRFLHLCQKAGADLLWSKGRDLCCKTNLEGQKLFNSLRWPLC